ncbi:MAG: metallophosphoesterase [Promethearchaeota archaeon]
MRKIENQVSNFLIEIMTNPLRVQMNNPNLPVPFNEFETLIKGCLAHLKNISNLVVLNENYKDLLIIADTHGFMDSTIRIIQPFLEEKVESLVFLGDYVDRGPCSLVNLTLVLALMIAWPNIVTILRGNHEHLKINAAFGFKKELYAYHYRLKEIKRIEELLGHLYNHLSLAALTPQKSITCHAGIPKGMKSIKELEAIPKPHDSLLTNGLAGEYKKALQILLNEPRENQDVPFRSYFKDNMFYFNETVVEDFLRNSDARRIIRGHESSRGGFQSIFNGKILHIISTEPYFDKISGARVIHEQSDGRTFLRDLDFNEIKEIKIF